MTSSPGEVRAGSPWRVPPGERAVAAAGLTAALYLGAAPSPPAAYHGVDESWAIGLNAAHGLGLEFGRDLVFTYGPWGFLDHPVTLGRLQFVIAFVFAVVVVAALWMTVWASLRRWVDPLAAALGATVLSAVGAAVAEPSTLALSACGGIAVLHLLTHGVRTQRRAPVDPLPVALAGVAGLLLQVKLSVGVFLLLIALVVACSQRSWRRALLDVLATAAAFVVSFVLFWVAAGQQLGLASDWLRGSVQVVGGYTEAMAIELPDALLGYLVGAALVAFATLLSVRAIRTLAWPDGVAVLLVTGAIAEFAFKAGFTRHDTFHEPAFFVALIGVVGAVGTLARRRGAVVVALVASACMIFPGLSWLDLKQTQNRWRVAVQASAWSGSAATFTDLARAGGTAQYQLPQEFIDGIGKHPVAVDPWDAALPIAYGMRWHPVPVFQTYAAYTSDLDALNAAAARRAPDDQVVLRLPIQAIDGRNSRWDTPAYLLTLACDYSQQLTDGTWSLLRHDTPRCQAEERMEPVHLAAGDVATVPTAGPDDIVVAHFVPDPDGALSRLFHTVFKDPSTLAVTADDLPYRVPQRLAPGPLMMTYPGRGEQGLFPAYTYHQVSFSMPGTLTFGTVALDR